MKKLYKLLLICLLILCGGNALKAQDKAYETPTLVNGYYEISKADHLFWFAATVNSGTAPINAVLTNDINLGNTSWTPIGSLANPYSGHFDGQGYTISGLNINGVFSWETTASNGTNTGLFGSINNAGIHNLTVSGSNTATVSTSMESSIVSSGLLVGHMTDAIVYNCFANGTVTSSGYQSVGGLVGTAQHSIIINCGSEAAVTIETTVLSRSIGGLVGHMTAGYDFPLCLLNSWCTGNVTTGEHGNVGGLVGYLADDAVNNYYSGTLSANKDDNVGQLFGYVYNKIRVSPDDEDLTIFTPVIEKNYYKSGTAVGFVEEGMNDTGFVETYSDMEDLRKKMNSNLPLVNAIIDGHRGYLSTTEWAELISLLNGEDVKAFHWYNNGSSLNLHDTFSANGFCSICGAYEPAKLVDNYYEIYNAGNLFWFAEYVNTIDRTASAKLMNDIDLENRPWTPIGFTGEGNNNFRGHFDGNGKTITGLNVTVTRNGGGFFGEVRLGTVEDFTIYGEVKLNGKHSYVGGVIGSAPGANSNQPEHNGATIRNITSYVNVTLGEGSHGSNHVAGFIGYANHETLIENCTWYGTLDLDAYRAQDGVGGLVGKANDNSEITIRNCAAYGTIKTSYQSGSYNSHNSIYIGGIVSNSVASAQTTLENCIWAGTLINNTNLGNDAHISAIGTLNGIKSVSNCYALNNMPYITTNDAHNEGITEVTAGQLASGEIAYKLQGTQATQIWGQNIDNEETANAKPILGGAKVYEHTFDGTTLYSNSQTLTAGGKCGDNLYWTVSDNTLTIFGTGAMYDYKGTSSNKAPWRSLNPAPKSLVLEEGITHIGNAAFYFCEGFNGSLTIPNSVTSIGNNAFEYCKFFTGSLTIPNSVTSIGNYAFYYCKGFTGSLTIPNSVTSIGNSAFEYCYSFTGSLTIGNSVTSIGNSAFKNCSGFNEVYSLAETAPTLGTSVFSGISSDATLYYPASSEQSYDDNGWFNYFSKRFSFGKCGDNLYWKVIDKILTIFGTGAMNDYDNIDNKAPWRSLNPAPTSLVMEEGITHIGNYAFYGCDGFTKVHSSAVIAPTLGTEAFANINKNTILYHPVSSEPSYEEKGWFEYFLQHVGADGQCGDNLYWKVSDNTLTIFGTGAMYDYEYDGDNISPWKKLETAPTSLVLEEGITHIGNSAFDSCFGFTGSLTIPNSVTSIGKYAFYDCKGFTGDLTIPNSVTTIGNYAFARCYGFTGSLTIGNSVTSIGEGAFYYCNGFTEIFFYRDTNPTIGSNAFSNINANVYTPVIWESFSNIPEDKLVKMPTFVGEQSASTGWVGLAEDQTWPDEDDHVAINAPMVISGQQSANSLSVKSFGLCGNENTTNGSITIEDGGQLYCEVARGEVTVKKEILGYQQSAVSGQQSESESETKWYTIASPLKDTIQIIPNSSFITPNSDLYRYDEPSYTWQNAKNSANNGFNTIDPGRGYLYANAENTTLEFTGNINTKTVTYNLTAKSDVLNGFHLVGNPFTHNITFAHLNATEGASLVNGYYVLNGEGAWGATLGSNEDDVIKVGQGVLVKATAEGTLAISRQLSAISRQRSGKGQQTTDNGQQSLCISVSNAKYSDRAFVVFDKGVGLDKMNHENEDIPLLYIPMEDADYAIAMMDMNVNEIPVNFETNVMGEYTISLRQENCEFDELYLLDKETDEKVNILEQDYTFIATSSENPERFILMKDAQGSQLEAHSHFAYINNGDIVIYNIEGDADIKIFDALGRCVYQGESSDETTRIANGYSSGVYMIQKVDDNGVKVQKVMID